MPVVDVGRSTQFGQQYSLVEVPVSLVKKGSRAEAGIYSSVCERIGLQVCCECIGLQVCCEQSFELLPYLSAMIDWALNCEPE